MQFRVGPLIGPPDPLAPSLVLPAIVPLYERSATTVRDLTLNEDFDSYGRLIQRLGTSVRLSAGTFARNFGDTATETPRAGDTEVWRIFNLTGDTHPIHFHLVNVQILERQPFDAKHYTGTPKFHGPPRPPDPSESGWKETVRMNPGEMTKVIMNFQVPAGAPVSLRTGGYNYVWHCHILEHEEHDMMRPLIVMP
jgi:spore coat protein A